MVVNDFWSRLLFSSWDNVIIILFGLLSLALRLFFIRKLHYIFVSGHKGFHVLFTITPIVSCCELMCLSFTCRLSGYEILNAMTITSIITLAVNSLFLAWWSPVYIVPPSNLYLPASWLLWGTTCSLGMAYALANNSVLIV